VNNAFGVRYSTTNRHGGRPAGAVTQVHGRLYLYIFETRKVGNCESIATWRPSDVASVVLFWLILYRVCAQTANYQIDIIIWRSDNVFMCATLTFNTWPWSWTFVIHGCCMICLPNLTEIEQSAAVVIHHFVNFRTFFTSSPCKKIREG